MQVYYYPEFDIDDADDDGNTPDPIQVDVGVIVSEALHDNPQEAYRILLDQLERHTHILKVRLSDPDKQGVIAFAKSIGA